MALVVIFFAMKVAWYFFGKTINTSIDKLYHDINYHYVVDEV